MMMRTTLTLDADIAARLKKLAQETGRPFKAIVNDHLRLGLDRAQLAQLPPFKVIDGPRGLRPGISLDSASALFDLLDGPDAH